MDMPKIDQKTPIKKALIEELTSHHNVIETGRDVNLEVGFVAERCANHINSGNFFQEVTSISTTSKSLEKAALTLEKAQSVFWEQMQKMTSNANALEDTSRKVMGRVRDTQQKLTDSLKKIDATINIDRLERQVVLLERAADAMQRLGQLQTAGKLDKILAAMK